MKYFNIEGSYFGGKGAAGVAQKIINQIPPHEMFISGFLGYCRVMQYKRPAKFNCGFDMDKSVLEIWNQLQHPEGGHFKFLNLNTISFLESGEIESHDFVDAALLHIIRWKIRLCRENGSPIFIYLDPPYLLDARSDPRERYRYELSEEEHHRLIAAARNLRCMVAISHYPHPLYDELLNDGWRYIDFNSRTRGGTARERLYMNYPEPERLHDYSYLGDNFKEREQIKLKFDRWKSNFEALSHLEQDMRKEWLKNSTLL